MKRKQKFETPAVLLELDLGLEGRMLFQKSAVDSITVTTMGQERETIDFSGDDSPFKYDWE